MVPIWLNLLGGSQVGRAQEWGSLWKVVLKVGKNIPYKIKKEEHIELSGKSFFYYRRNNCKHVLATRN